MNTKTYRIEGYYTDEPQLFCEDVEATSEAEAIELVRAEEGRTGLTITNSDELTEGQRIEKAAPAMLAALKDAQAFIKSQLDAPPASAIDFLVNNGEEVEADIEKAIAAAEGRT